MEYEVLKKLVDEGLSQKKIGEKLGVSQTKVCDYLRKYNIETNYSKSIKIPKNLRENNTCTKCNLIKPSIEFTFFTYKDTGEKYITSLCNECAKLKAKTRRRTFKELALEYKGNKCIICGYNKCI